MTSTPRKCLSDLKTFPLQQNIFDLHHAKEKTVPKFYVVQKAGVPAVWESDPQQIGHLLKRKTDFTVISDEPSDTRADALTKLRQLFPGSRPMKPRQ